VNTPHPMEKKEKEIKTYKTLPNIQVGWEPFKDYLYTHKRGGGGAWRRKYLACVCVCVCYLPFDLKNRCSLLLCVHV
jgi:hypothetical protein